VIEDPKSPVILLEKVWESASKVKKSPNRERDHTLALDDWFVQAKVSLRKSIQILGS
jgi:hypothetical protein